LTPAPTDSSNPLRVRRYYSWSNLVWVFRPRIVRTIFVIVSSVLLFLLAVFASTQFRIPGGHTTSRVIPSSKNVLIVSVAFIVLCLVIGQFKLQNVARKQGYLVTASVLMFVAALVIVEPIERPFFISYGDWETLVRVIKGPGVFARWALGSSVLSSIYIAFTSFLAKVTAAKFLAVFSSLFVLGATYLTITKSKGRLSYLLPLMSPMWIAFCFGYDEYNAFVSPIVLFVALWIFWGEQPKSATVASICAGLLPALYVGLGPISIIVMLKLLVPRKNWNERMTSIAIWLVAYVGAIEFSWPKGHIDYLKNLTSDLMLGSAGGYEGMASSDKSPFFNIQTVLSYDHLSGVGYMLLFGAGLASVIFFLAVLALPALGFAKVRKTVAPLISLGWIQWLFVIWSVFYIVALMAKLGPTGDIDAFYSSYITISIMVGLVADRISERWGSQLGLKNKLVWAIAIVNGPLLAGLVIFGVQHTCEGYSLVRGWCGA
jgi:hypothetical protein